MNWIQKIGVIAIVGMLLAVSSCKTTKKLADNSTLTDEDIILSLNRGPCFGKCPVYDLTLYNNGYMLYNAKRFVKEEGLFARNLSAEELEVITNKLKASDWMSMDNKYKSDITDLPYITMVHTQDGVSHSIGGREERPLPVKEVQYAVEKHVDSPGWQLLGPVKSNHASKKKDDAIIYDEIIIVPAVKNRLPIWFKKNKKYGFAIKKRISKEMDMWLITYDTKAYTPDQIMDVLKNDPSISKAEFNRKAENRDGSR